MKAKSFSIPQGLNQAQVVSNDSLDPNRCVAHAPRDEEDPNDEELDYNIVMAKLKAGSVIKPSGVNQSRELTNNDRVIVSGTRTAEQIASVKHEVTSIDTPDGRASVQHVVVSEDFVPETELKHYDARIAADAVIIPTGVDTARELMDDDRVVISGARSSEQIAAAKHDVVGITSPIGRDVLGKVVASEDFVPETVIKKGGPDWEG